MDTFGRGDRDAARRAVALLGEAVVTACLPVLVRFAALHPAPAAHSTRSTRQRLSARSQRTALGPSMTTGLSVPAGQPLIVAW